MFSTYGPSPIIEHEAKAIMNPNISRLWGHMRGEGFLSLLLSVGVILGLVPLVDGCQSNYLTNLRKKTP
jgi:hypothetical protein